MTTRQIPFIYGEQSKSIPFIYLDKNSLTAIEFPVVSGSRIFSMGVEDDTEPRRIDFSLGRDITPIPFTIGIWDNVPAILGVLDPYTLGELDSMSIDFRMYDGIEKLITTDIHGVNGDSIFKYQEPVHFPYYYRIDPFDLPFCLGDKFMRDRWVTKPEPLYLALWNTDNGIKAEPVIQKGADVSGDKLYLVNNKSELLSRIVLWCKSIYGFPQFLGECDPYTLGELDPFLLGALDKNIASAIRLGESTKVSLGHWVTTNPTHDDIGLINCSLEALNSAVVAQPVMKTDGLVNGKVVRAATLGDLDPHNLLAVDTRKLDMRVFSKTPLIVTTE